MQKTYDLVNRVVYYVVCEIEPWPVSMEETCHPVLREVTRKCTFCLLEGDTLRLPGRRTNSVRWCEHASGDLMRLFLGPA